MKLIKNFEINTDDLSALQESRSFKVSGDDSAVFSLQIRTSVGRVYNFNSRLFEATETTEHRLTNQEIIGKTYSGEILFPADTDGETYTIFLQAEPHFDTNISSGLIGTDTDGTTLSFNPTLFRTSITQVADVVVTFQPVSAVTAFTDATLAQTTTVRKSPTITTPTTTTVSWVADNLATDAAAFGLVIASGGPTMSQTASDASLGFNGDISDGAWYASTTATVDDTKSDVGGGSTHGDYVVDSIGDLTVGMIITAISSGTLGAVPTLTRVSTYPYTDTDNPNKPFIELSSVKAFANGITLTLKGYGINAVDKATGCDITFSNFILTQKPLTTTVRGGVSSSTTITVDGTYGIGKGAYFEGFSVNNASNNPIAAVGDVDADGGGFTSTVAQTLVNGTVLNIIGSSDKYTITGDVTINKMPASNTTISLDLDKLLTLGTAS